MSGDRVVTAITTAKSTRLLPRPPISLLGGRSRAAAPRASARAFVLTPARSASEWRPGGLAPQRGTPGPFVSPPRNVPKGPLHPYAATLGLGFPTWERDDRGSELLRFNNLCLFRPKFRSRVASFRSATFPASLPP